MRALVVLTGDLPELERAVREAGLDPLPDRVPGAGPLGGVHAALELALEAGDAGVLFLPCDMPLVPEAVPRALARAPALPGERALVASSGAPPVLHPLCARFHTSALRVVRTRLEPGENRSIFGLLEALDARSLSFDRTSLDGLDPARAFAGANPPKALDGLERLARTPHSESPNAR